MRLLCCAAPGFVLAGLVGSASAALAGPGGCDTRVNNTAAKLLECVTLEGVRAHQAAFQAIADANGGTRAAGTPGATDSILYVANRLQAAGYAVQIQPFSFPAFRQLGPSTLRQVAPGAVVYVEGVDYGLLSFSAAGDVTAPVTAVDIQLGSGNTSSSGCEASDFAGFPPGNIALLQSGQCELIVKANNAAAAGAVGAIIFNQGDTSERTGLLEGTLGSSYSGGIPVVGATYARGVEWDVTAGLRMQLSANVTSGIVSSANVIADSSSGRTDNVVVAGAHLDSVVAGPGINDNGSGSAVLLEVALQLKKLKPRNQLRFAFWGAREEGQVGSRFYLDGLAPAQRDAIALYLDFHMLGSPNFVRFVHGGASCLGENPGPLGSEAIERLFRDHYERAGLAYELLPFDPGSDLPGFLEAGIPSGGLFGGSQGIKTAAQAVLFGGTAGVAYDPCFHNACDTYANVSLDVLDQHADAAAFAILTYAMGTESVNGQ